MTHGQLSTDEGVILHFCGTQAGRLQDGLDGYATPFQRLSVRQGFGLLTQHACGTHAWGRLDGPDADHSPDSSRP